MDIEEIQKGDRYMLCSDGLTKHLSDYEIEETLGHGNARECCKDLIDMTLMRGAGDNVTVVVVDIF
jgi:serine/threonine protein phosphatase PrpC